MKFIALLATTCAALSIGSANIATGSNANLGFCTGKPTRTQDGFDLTGTEYTTPACEGSNSNAVAATFTKGSIRYTTQFVSSSDLD